MFKENQNEKVLTESRPESIETENSKLERAINLTGKEISDWMETTGKLEYSHFRIRMTTFLVGLFLAFGAMGETAQAQDWRRMATRGVESVVVNAEREKSSQYIEQFQREPFIHPFLAAIERLRKGNRYSKYEDEAYTRVGNEWRG